MLFMLLVIFTLGYQASVATLCPNTATTNDTKPLYLLVLRHSRTSTSVKSLPGLRIAQDEFNSRSDFLPGYRFELILERTKSCSYLETGLGLNKLVKHTVSPPCHPVVAVLALSCSSHLSLMSPLAGHDGYDLIQLTSASAPICQNQHFPHLWRLSGPASVLLDTILAIMDQFNWTQIGVVYNSDSALYYEVARHFQQVIKGSKNKSIAFSFGIGGTKSYYIDSVVSNIISKETAIIISFASFKQLQALMFKTNHLGIVYPQYVWIHTGKLHIYNIRQSFFVSNTVGHFLIDMQSEVDSEDTRLVSNETFGTFKAKYTKDLELLEKQYNARLLPTKFLATKLYDQMWAIGLAVNKSLPILKNRNLSIDNYTIGQPEVTRVIEEQMANLSFQGASGWVEFNQYRNVPKQVNVHWILTNGTAKHVGTYNPLKPSNFKINIHPSDLPKDTVPRVYQYILIPLPLTVMLYLLTSGVLMFTTVQLILYLCYRHHKMIKATSPYLSLLMFAGCYLFHAAALLTNTYGSFPLSPEIFTAMSITNFFFIINGISLILLTLSVKLMRLHRIFGRWMKQDLSKLWGKLGNLILSVVFLLSSLIPNIGLAILIALLPPTHSTINRKFIQGHTTIVEIHTRIEPTSNYIFTSLATMYICVFLAMVLIMGLRNCKINMKIIDISGQIYLLLAVLVIIIFLAMSIGILFLVREQEPIANAIMTTLFLVCATACQLILFLPTTLTALLEDKSPCLLASLKAKLSYVI